MSATDQDLQALRRIELSISSARDLVDGLRRLQRPNGVMSSHNLTIIFRELFLLLGSSRIKRYKITHVYRDEGSFVYANKNEFFLVLLNIILNACDACTSVDGKVSIETLRSHDEITKLHPIVGSYSRNVNYSIFRVVDTGVGMKPSLQSRLFKRSFTTKGENGTGLGLQIVANILRKNRACL